MDIRFKGICRRRKGMTLVETVIAILLLSLAVLVMARLTGVKVDHQANLSSQYSIQAVDAFFYDVYNDFHNASTFSVTQNTDGGYIMLFDLGDGNRSLYEFKASEKAMYSKGMEVFKCSNLEIRGAGNSLYVAVRLPSERVLEMDIFK